MIKAHISRLPEGGVSLVLGNGARRASLDAYATGEIVAAAYYCEGDPEVWEVEKTGASLAQALERMFAYLDQEPSK